MSELRNSRLKLFVWFWLIKLKSVLWFGLVILTFILISVGSVSSSIKIELGEIIGSQETVRHICLWLGSLLFLVAVPGSSLVYLHDWASQKRRICWLRIMNGVFIIGVVLFSLAVPIAQFFSAAFGSNVLGRK